MMEYALPMRTSISLDDRLAERVKRTAAEEGVSVSAFIARVLDDALKRKTRATEAPPFRLVTAGEGGTYPGVDLDRTRDLLVAEDEERFGSRRREP